MKNTLYLSQKLFISVFSFLLVGMIYTVSASAFTLSPASGQLSTNQTQTVQILANRTTVNAATLRLTVANGTISNYVDGNGVLGIGECAGSAKSTATTVCVSVASTGGNFTSGQVLGTFTLTKTGTTAATITASAGSQYVDGTAVSGVLATYSAASTTTTGGTTTSTTGSTTGTLPNTASSSFAPTNIVILGLLIIAIGLLLGVTIKVARKED